MVDVQFYTDVWHGSLTDAETIERLLDRATDVINSEIFLTGFNVDTVPESKQRAVYKAVCAQADYIDSSGGVEAMSENTAQGMSLGRFSYTGGGASGSSAGSSSASRFCEQARMLLLPTGLLYRGVKAL